MSAATGANVTGQTMTIIEVLHSLPGVTNKTLFDQRYSFYLKHTCFLVHYYFLDIQILRYLLHFFLFCSWQYLFFFNQKTRNTIN